eukprot:Em0017g167a
MLNVLYRFLVILTSISMEQSMTRCYIAFCCDCKYSPECSKNEKDCIRRRAKNFVVKEVKDEVWHTIGVNLIGPLPETQKETNTGASRQSPVCFPSGQRQLLSLTKQQQECMVNYELCRLCGIQYNMTSAYHPQSNGLDERILPFKHSPIYLVYGRQPRLPIEFTMKCPGASEWCVKPEDGLQHAILVNIKNSKKLSKKGSKMEPNWTSPYLIHEVLSKGTYRLSKSNPPFKVQAQKYDMTRLKIFYQKDQPKDSHPMSEVQVDVGVEETSKPQTYKLYWKILMDGLTMNTKQQLSICYKNSTQTWQACKCITAVDQNISVIFTKTTHSSSVSMRMATTG